MKRRNRKFSIGILAAICFIFISAPVSRADVLAEFLFWDSMGKQTGKAAQSYIDYERERQHWRDKIAAAKKELDKCGGCASAQAKLDKWQGVRPVSGGGSRPCAVGRYASSCSGISRYQYAPFCHPFTAKTNRRNRQA